MQQIKVEIDENGKIEIEALGYEGSSCEEATQWLEEALGFITHTEHKPEYYRQARIQQKGQQRHGS
jgi:hypothetical protein